MWHPMKPETVARRATKRLRDTTERRERLISTLREKYANEPDREYAEEMWGDMLRDLGKSV